MMCRASSFACSSEGYSSDLIGCSMLRIWKASSLVIGVLITLPIFSLILSLNYDDEDDSSLPAAWLDATHSVIGCFNIQLTIR